MALISPRYLSFHIRLVVFLFSFPKKERFSLDRMRILMHLHLHICIPQVYYYKNIWKSLRLCHLTDIPATCHIAEPRVRDIVQEVLDYWDLNYYEFAIPGLMKYSVCSSNSSVIRICNFAIVVLKLSGFLLSGNCFGPIFLDNWGPPVQQSKHEASNMHIVSRKLGEYK